MSLYDDLMAQVRELQQTMGGVVSRFVAEPQTMARLHRLMRNAGVEYRQATNVYEALSGIPFIEDPTISRGAIEGRNYEGRVIRAYLLLDNDQLVELSGTAFDSYRGVTYLPIAARAGRAEGGEG